MQESQDSTQEVTSGDVVLELWRLKWIVLIVSVLVGVGAGLVAKVLPKQYGASIVVSPVSEDAGSKLGAIGSVLSEVGGLDSLGGLSGGGSRKSEYVAVLQSEALTEDYIRSKGLLQVLYAKLWDPGANKWTVHDVRKQPTVWKANRMFKKSVRTVLTDTHTGLVTMTIKWTDPVAAATWANDLVKLTNDYLRKKAIDEAERSIAYLSEQASKTEVVGVKQAIYSILESEINKETIARGREEFALRVVDPAIPPEVATSPVPILWAVAGLVASLLVFTLAIYFSLARKSGLLLRSSKVKS
jgi:uncharacterized protein involved in exopolysaccharide biosynthesis